MNLCFASLPPVSSWNYSCVSTNRCFPPSLCQMSTGVLGFGGTVPRYKMSAEDKDLAKRFFADRFMRLQDQVQTRTHTLTLSHSHTLTRTHAHTRSRTYSSRLFLWNYKSIMYREHIQQSKTARTTGVSFPGSHFKFHSLSVPYSLCFWKPLDFRSPCLFPPADPCTFPSLLYRAVGAS